MLSLVAEQRPVRTRNLIRGTLLLSRPPTGGFRCCTWTLHKAIYFLQRSAETCPMFWTLVPDAVGCVSKVGM
jgi:hypothetical protein